MNNNISFLTFDVLLIVAGFLVLGGCLVAFALGARRVMTNYRNKPHSDILPCVDLYAKMFFLNAFAILLGGFFIVAAIANWENNDIITAFLGLFTATIIGSTTWWMSRQIIKETKRGLPIIDEQLTAVVCSAATWAFAFSPLVWVILLYLDILGSEKSLLLGLAINLLLFLVIFITKRTSLSKA